MQTESVRLSQLKRLIPLASKKALVASLRALEINRIIVRRNLSNTVLHVEYDMEQSMREALGPLLDSLAGWGHFYEDDVIGTSEVAR